MEIKRYENNPIILKNNINFRVNSIFNAGAVKYNNQYLLICRIEMPNGRSAFIKAVSNDGYSYKLDDKPCLTSDDHKQYIRYCDWGIEDARIVFMEGKYYLTYTGYSKYMPVVLLAETVDFENFNILGPISEPSNKDCSLFPEKINGKYYRMDRPTADSRKDIWLSSSPDLIHWGNYQILAEPLSGTWETNKIGNSTPPIKTDEGWLYLYHGVRGFEINSIYKLGVMLLDLKNPAKIIGRCSEPILAPDLDYERIGDVPNVVFSNGWIAEPNGNIKIYYSGADTNICLAETSIKELLDACR
ncbi:MAG: glycoside hydrolase family 130 protein [Bacteroidota bacterium]|nr:glycoside hydrolase family 130 protein [Bacteroidota bacterium]